MSYILVWFSNTFSVGILSLFKVTLAIFMKMCAEVQERKIVVLSRFFSRNTYLVAGMCWKCYKEATDVKITSINTQFLKNSKKYEASDYFLNFGNCMFVLDDSKEALPNSVTTESIEHKTRDFFIKNEEIINKNIKEIIKYEKEELASMDEEKYQLESKFFKTKFKNSPLKTEFFKSSNQKTELTNLKITSKLNLNFFNDVIKYEVKFVPPKSPYNLIEESLYHDPWALLVATVFLNRTKLAQSKPYIEWFLADYKTPYQVLRSEICNLEKYFGNLGLQRTRAVQIYRMSYDFLHKNWKHVEELHGIGEYGRDAFNMFILGNFEVKPKDRYLRIYRDWYQRNFLEENSDFDSDFLTASSQSDKEVNKDNFDASSCEDMRLENEDRLCFLHDVFEEFYLGNSESIHLLSSIKENGEDA